MLMLSGFELYPRWVPLFVYVFQHSAIFCIIINKAALLKREEKCDIKLPW